MRRHIICGWVRLRWDITINTRGPGPRRPRHLPREAGALDRLRAFLDLVPVAAAMSSDHFARPRTLLRRPWGGTFMNREQRASGGRRPPDVGGKPQWFPRHFSMKTLFVNSSFCHKWSGASLPQTHFGSFWNYSATRWTRSRSTRVRVQEARKQWDCKRPSRGNRSAPASFHREEKNVSGNQADLDLSYSGTRGLIQNQSWVWIRIQSKQRSETQRNCCGTDGTKLTLWVFR